jgi:acetyl esterase/lipase
MLTRHDHPTQPADLQFTEAMVRNVRFGSAYRESGDVAEMRAATERLLAMPFVRGVDTAVRRESGEVGGVPGEWLIPDRIEALARICTLVFFHGGGYVRGSLALGRSTAADLARNAGLRCVCPAYRQAPEHRFPAPVDDAVAVCQALAAETEGRLLLAGESAGGGIVVAAAMRLRELTRNARLTAVAAISPFFDLTQSGESWSTNAARDIATAAMAQRLADLYADEADRRHPLASPVFGDFRGLAPLHVAVGGHEVLLSESETLARDAAAAGVDVTLEVFDGMPHGFIKYRLEAAELALEHVGRWLGRHTL